MFIVDWNEDDFGELNFYDIFDIFYPLMHGQNAPYTADDNLEVEYPEIPYPEVVNYVENNDGTMTLTVNVVFPEVYGAQKRETPHCEVSPFLRYRLDAA